MTPYGFAALENIEYEASIDLYRAAPEDLRVAHAIEVRDIGAATCLTSRGLPRGNVAGKPRVRASGRRGFRAAVHGRALGRIARGSGEVGLRPGVRRRHARRCGSRIPEQRVRVARAWNDLGVASTSRGTSRIACSPPERGGGARGAGGGHRDGRAPARQARRVVSEHSPGGLPGDVPAAELHVSINVEQAQTRDLRRPGS